jgi:hypothetical protein
LLASPASLLLDAGLRIESLFHFRRYFRTDDEGNIAEVETPNNSRKCPFRYPPPVRKSYQRWVLRCISAVNNAGSDSVSNGISQICTRFSRAIDEPKIDLPQSALLPCRAITRPQLCLFVIPGAPVTALLLAIAIWTFARFYYFVFYQPRSKQYVDAATRFRGLLSLVAYHGLAKAS